MPLSNAELAGWLERYANMSAVAGADRFKVKAYRRAARTIEGMSHSAAERLLAGDDLTDLPGIGRGISGVLKEIVSTGKLALLEHATARLSPELQEIASRPALNAKDVLRVYKRLGLKTLAELKQALEAGRIGEEFGARLEFQIRRGLDDRPRLLLYEALPLASRMEERLRGIVGVHHVAAVGSLRRCEDTVGDLNFLVASDRASKLFRELPAVLGVKPTDSNDRRQHSFRLGTGGLVTIRWTLPAEWGLSLLQATGSAAHLRDLTQWAKRRPLSLTKTALVRKGVDVGDESKIYAALRLPTIPPELREGRGEVAAAASDALPDLIAAEDIRGDLHMHTTASDGSNTIAEMVATARKRGYDYIAITDHSQSLTITNGLSPKRLLQQIRSIDRLNAGLKGFRILKSAEVDILEDGRLDYPDEVLRELDLTICSIHSKFRLDKSHQTERILRAMDNPYFNILGHASGRLLLKRPGYELDWERIFSHARQNGCHFEINASPYRLDLSDEHAKMAKELGIKIAVNTDAHSLAELDYLAAGIRQARRAWLTKDDVLNTRNWRSLKKLLKR